MQNRKHIITNTIMMITLEEKIMQRDQIFPSQNKNVERCKCLQK